jgi:hypothetical protein
MYIPISIFYHFFNIAVVADASAPIVSLVHGLDDGLILFEKGVVEQIE